MNLPQDFLKDEVRDGFYISGKMKRCWAAQLKVLSEIDKVCKKYNITYFAEWGTLLGTIRHGGYIPWDDDLDICMKRADYDRFIKIASKELPEGYAAHTYESEFPIWDFMCRVANTTSIRLDEEFLKENYDCPYAVGIDVFPLDYMAPDEEKEADQYEKLNYALTVAEEYDQGVLDKLKLETKLTKIEKYSNERIDRNGDIKRQLYKIADKYFSLYGEGDSEYLTQIGIRSTTRSGHVFKKEYYSRAVYLDFEGFSMPVPIGYQNILKQKYGDFMKLVKIGGSHEYPCFKRQENRLKKAGFNMPIFNLREAIDNKKELNVNRIPKEHFKDMVISNLEILKEATQEVDRLLINLQDINGALDLLNQCQETAIMIGNSIEGVYGEGLETVHNLEKYCETLFELFNAVNCGNSFDEIISSLHNIISSGISVAQNELVDKLNIVFIVWTHKYWKEIAPYYNKYKNDSNYTVNVILVPYFDKNFNGKLTESYIELDKFPKDIKLTLFNDYDLKNNHPDIIYTQYAYDEYHDTMSIHPDYYTKNLFKYTDKLIYVPYIKATPSAGNERDVESMQYYINSPGIVYADMVVIDTNENKKAYIDYLISKDNGYDAKELDNKFILAKELLADTDDNINNDNLYKKKKTLLFNVDTSFIIEYKKAAIDKLKEVYGLFMDNKDKLNIIWTSQTDENILTEYISKELVEEYHELIMHVRNVDNITYIDMLVKEDKYSINIEEIDVYYGVAGVLAHQIRGKSKPVMIMNVI